MIMSYNSQLDVTVLRAENLPRLKTLFGRKRKFYALVTGNMADKKTEYLRSVAQAVQWNERLRAFDIHPSSRIEISLYAKKTIGKDILVGKKEIPCNSQTETAFLFDSGDGSGNSRQPMTVYLTTVVLIPSPSPATLTGAEGANIIEQKTVYTTTATATLTTNHPVETIQPPHMRQIDESPFENDLPELPKSHANVHTEISPEKVLEQADKATKALNTSETWKSAVENIKWVMDTLAPLAELHPFAKMAWDLVSKIPQPFIQQFERDDNVRTLLEAMRDGFDFAKEAAVLKTIKPRSKQAHILMLMLQHVCNCGDFIVTYAKNSNFRKRFLKNITGKLDVKIEDYRTALEKFRRELLDYAAITTEINTFQILDDVGIISVAVKGISTQLEKVSSKVSDLGAWPQWFIQCGILTVKQIDLDTKFGEMPYKSGWRFDIKRDYLPGTRTEFLDYIVDWANNLNAERTLVLFGQAGTGKSSIAHQIARRFRDMNRLTSYFVFLRTEQTRREDYFLLTTLIHDLARRYPSYRTALGTAIRNDKALRAARDYHTLFERLLLQPLRDLHIVGPVLVVVDALDESGDASGENGLHTFLANFTSRLPSEFRILITSRRERDIDLAFAEAPSARIVEMTDHTLAATTGDDIRAYLRTNLPRKVFQKHGTSLEIKAEGLFQWAAVASGYIRRPPPGFTTNQCLKSLLYPSPNNEGLEVLDKLYRDILEGYFASPQVRPRFRSVMGQLFAAFEPLSIASLTSLRNYASGDERDEEGSVVAIVGYLGSLLSNVTLSESSLPIVPLHTSFRDFLTDAKKSGHFYVDLKTAHDDLAGYCLSLMLNKLKFNICNLESSYLANRDVPNLVNRINEYIPMDLCYACRFWDDHLERIDFSHYLLNQLRTFFNIDFLFWLEVLSLTGDVALASSALSALKKWLEFDAQKLPRSHRDIVQEINAFVNDASIFVRYFAMPISKSAPHIYVSCLPFTPASSNIFRHYSRRFPNTLSLQRGQLTQWPALEMVIPTNKPVNSVSFSLDGQYIVSGSDDNLVHVWNAQTGELMGEPFIGHEGAVLSVSFSPDGQYIASGSIDCTIRVWNARTTEMVGKPLIGHQQAVKAVSFSPDGRYVVSGSEDCTIRMWNAMTGEMIREPFIGHEVSVLSISFSPDTGRYIVSGASDGKILMWNARTGEVVKKRFSGYGRAILSASFSSDRQRVVSEASSDTRSMWNVITGQMVENPFTGHSSAVWCVSFSPDGRYVVSTSSDRTIRVWNATTGKMVGNPLRGHEGTVWSASFSPDGQYIVSASSDRTIRLWNTTTGKLVGNPFSGHKNAVWSVSFSPGGQHIISASSDRTIRMWNAAMGKMVGKPSHGRSPSFNSVSFSPDGQRIVSGSPDSTIHLWNARTGGTMGELFGGHVYGVLSASFSPDGQHVVSSSAASSPIISVLNAATGEMVIMPFRGHNISVNSVSFSPDGQRIASGSGDHIVRIWNAKTGEMVGKPFTGHEGSVTSVSFSPDGQRIVSGSGDKTIRIWNVTTGGMVGSPFIGHQKAVSSVSFSPDGQYIGSGSYDSTICVWNAVTGELVGNQLSGHTHPVFSISFSPDGQYIVSASADRTIRMWNARTGEVVGKPFCGHDDWIRSVSFSPDGRYIVSASTDRTIRMWDTTKTMVRNPPSGHHGSAASVASRSDDHSRNGMEQADVDRGVHYTDNSIIGSDGWIYGPEGELLLWIPQLHRHSLHRPSNVWIISEHDTRMDLSRFAHGRNWGKCVGGE